MNYKKKYLSLALLVISKSLLYGNCCSSTNNCTNVVTSFVPMTTGQDLVTQKHEVLFPDGSEDPYGSDICSWAVDARATYRFQSTRNGSTIANTLFGSNALEFQGDGVEERSPNALIAEYFGMGYSTDTALCLSPKLTNNICDLQVAVSGEKFWLQINVPIVWSKWRVSKCGVPDNNVAIEDLDGGSLSLTTTSDGAKYTAIANDNSLYNFDKATNVGSFDGTDSFEAIAINSFAQCAEDGVYQSSDEAKLADGTTSVYAEGDIEVGLYGTFSGANESFEPSAEYSVQTVKSLDLPTALKGNAELGMFAGRKLNNFDFSPCGTCKVADVPIMLGYDFCKSDAAHFGAYLKFVIPTGTKIDACFLSNVLTPVIGNGHHFEFGAGLSGHTTFWVCDESSLGLYADGYITHMFGTCQTRTFDLKNQPMSRYSLAYGITNGTVQQNIYNIGDINLYNGNVSVGARGEFLFELLWAHRNIEAGFGYAFKGQSSENICQTSCCSTAEATAAEEAATKQTFGFVGQAYQNYINIALNEVLKEDKTTTPVTEANAGDANGFKSEGATSNAIFPQYYTAKSNQTSVLANGENSIYNYGVSTENDAGFVLPDIENNTSGLMSGQVLNRLFAHLDYVWRDCAWQPELGILGSIGFSPSSKPTAAYWDLGARFGVAF